jgi:hypothetical protein
MESLKGLGLLVCLLLYDWRDNALPLLLLLLIIIIIIQLYSLSIERHFPC